VTASATFQAFLDRHDAEMQYRLKERCAIHEHDGGLSRLEAEQRTIAEADQQWPQGEML
jgi:hypothetical protein